ncbi:TPA: hypothetical protein HA265_07955 [Candidatus Woesearchaeota archaeon]|nr:hypothetical protein [Candidatus Woesearchaeota archaeon]
MLDKRDLDLIRKKVEAFDMARDKVIAESREVVKLSKRIIYSLHRDDKKDASAHLASIQKAMQRLDKAVPADSKLRTQGSFKVAVQEYVEAVCFFKLLHTNKIPTHTQLKVDPEYYLLGLIDLVGELVRRAINSAIKGDYNSSVRLKDLVSELYDQLLLFDFSGGELRKKFDSIKYDLKKLEDLVLNLKLSSKI